MSTLYIEDRIHNLYLFLFPITANKLRKKWKYLRDRFSKELSKVKKPHSGDEGGETQTSKWHYCKSLYFLKDIIKSRCSSGNLIRSEKRKNQKESQNNDITSETIDAADDVYEYDMVGNELPDNADDEDGDNLVEEIVSVRSETALGADTPSSITGTISRTRRAHQKLLKEYVARLKKSVFGEKNKATEDRRVYDTMLEIERKKFDLLARKTEQKDSNDTEDEDPHVKRIRPENILAFRGQDSGDSATICLLKQLF